MRRFASDGSKATSTFWMLTVLVVLVACFALRNATQWYGRPIPGVLVDAGGAISNIGLPGWASKKQGLQFPSIIVPLGSEASRSGSKARVASWDRAVAQASASGFLDAVVAPAGERRVVRLPVRPLEPTAWWVYAGSCLLAGLLYAGAGLVALWASPNGRLARAFARFAISSGLFLLCFFDIHTQHTLTPLYFVAYAMLSPSLVLVMLHLPTPVPLLQRHPWAETVIVALAFGAGLFVSTMHALGADVVRYQVLFTAMVGGGFSISVLGFLVRYASSRGEQQRTLRALLICMVPTYAGVGAFQVLNSQGVLAGFPDFLLFPAFIFAPLASLYAFVRYDLWGSRALLSRIGTSIFVGAIACAVAIATGAALATWMGAAFKDALGGAIGGGITAAFLVVLALRLSDFTLFRARAEYKPTID
ncbi:MAG TPA: hypothetical protein VFZ53_04240, partial [Polyangiaceae bacterium]